MALPKLLKDFNLFYNGNSWQGLVPSITLPELTFKMEEYRAGGMDAPVEIDKGMEKLSMEWQVSGLSEAIFEGFGTSPLNGQLMRFEGAFESDDDGVIKACTVTVRGRHSKIAMGEQKVGESGNHTVSTSLSYYKLDIDGKTFVEIDIPNYVCVINGVDRLEARRRALGL